MRTLRVIVKAAALACLTLIAVYGGRKLFVHVYAQSPTRIRPYHLEDEQIFVKDGKEKILSRTTKVRNQTGAIHELSVRYGDKSGAPGHGDVTFRSARFPDGTTALIQDSIRAKATAKLPEKELAARNASLRHPADCVEPGEIVEAHEQLFGQDAIRESIPQDKEGKKRLLGWRLLGFDCLVAQDFMQERSSTAEPWQTVMGNRLTVFYEAEPDPVLFTNWQGYAEMKPSDMKRKWAQAEGFTPETCAPCFQPDPSDGNYVKWHQGGQR